jgi:hypothetical protein
MVLAAVLGIAACAHRPPAVQNVEYGPKSLEGRTLVVFPLRDLEIRNKDDYEDDFGGRKGPTPKAQVELSRRFAARLIELSDHATLIADTAAGPDSIALKVDMEGVPRGDSTVNVDFRFPAFLPDSAGGKKPDLGLQLMDVSFQRVQGANGMGFMINGIGFAGGGLSPNRLVLTGHYMLWDYKVNGPVAFGIFSGMSAFQFAMDQGDWDNCIEEAAVFIVKHSQLGGKKLKAFEARKQAGNQRYY